jgi:hypothetical protein
VSGSGLLPELQDRSSADTIINVSAYACMIVGLKYVGPSDDLPIPITIGDVVDLQREPCQSPDSGAIAAYYDGTKVGYLSSEKQALWDSLQPSVRCQAKVMGEILDEDGNLAGLDIEMGVPPGGGEQPSAMEAAAAEKAPNRGKTLGISIGLAVLFVAVLADANSTGPAIPAVSSMTVHALTLVDQFPAMNEAELIKHQDRHMELAQVAKLTPSDQVLSMADSQRSLGLTWPASTSAQQMQANELSRIIQQANAHRLAMNLKRRAEVALFLQRAEMQKTQQLAEDLAQAREAAAQQRILFEELARQARETAAHWQAENRKLKIDIAQLQRRIEEMTFARQQLEEEERKQLALKELNQEELVRYKNRIAASTLVDRAPAQEVEKITNVSRQMSKEEASAASVVPTNKPKKRKKANFSRYAQENRDLE